MCSLYRYRYCGKLPKYYYIYYYCLLVKHHVKIVCLFVCLKIEAKGTGWTLCIRLTNTK